MKYLGDYSITAFSFKEQPKVFEQFQKKEFKDLGERQKIDKINAALLDLIQKAPAESFLLIPVVSFIDQIIQEKVLDKYGFSHFELWLNQFSGLSAEENYKVRGKIVGKFVPRDEYQRLFPVGMGKRYAGSHYITAHSSPDLDTTVASFWGWVDAFGARVGEGLHFWNVPGGAPPSVEIDLLFHKVFGGNVFNYLAKTRSSLGLSSIDLMNQRGVIKKLPEESMHAIDHERTQHAVIVVDEEGYYLGDWRSIDVEGVRQVIMMLNHCMHWFENDLHVKLISQFAKEKLSQNELEPVLRSIFELTFRECHPVKEFTEKQKRHLNDYLSKVLGVSKGLDASFGMFAKVMDEKGISAFQECVSLIESLPNSSLFTSGNLTESRSQILLQLEKVILSLDKAVQSVRHYEERLEVALNIKTQVFGYFPQVVSARADVEEIRSKMDSYPYLTVTSSDRDGKRTPLGVIHAGDLYKNTLGTVSLRDFCNRDETKIPSYLEVISVIDHHKTVLTTLSPPVAYITDSQSSNALVAELSFAVNDQYSTGGMFAEQIEKQIAEISRDLTKPSHKRILQRLLQRHNVADKKLPYTISPDREFLEYLHCLYAILDDTDLLTKVTRRDIECVASLLNRMKSLMMREEVEVVNFDDLPQDESFNAAAAKRLLQNKEMYSLYQKIYLSKEKTVEDNLQLCAEGRPSTIFVDTKEQNGCCRVGQTKLFARNLPVYQKLAPQIRKLWFEESQAVHKERAEIDLFMHMVSTVAGAEDVYSGNGGDYSHKDELWIWIPKEETAVEHLKSFLNAFKACPAVPKGNFEVEFLGNNAEELAQFFRESFIEIPIKTTQAENLPLAVVRYKAGLLNSRKAMISPYLPNLLA